MIANISPALSSCEHTLNTLRYADRVKELGRPDSRPEVFESDHYYEEPNSSKLSTDLYNFQIRLSK